MPLTHDIDTDRRLITISGQGGFADARESASRLFELQDVEGYSLLFLIEKSWMPEPGQLTMLRHWMGMMRHKFTGRIAIAASGLGQMTPALVLALTLDTGSDRVRAFSSDDEARAWLSGASAA